MRYKNKKSDFLSPASDIKCAMYYLLGWQITLVIGIVLLPTPLLFASLHATSLVSALKLLIIPKTGLKGFMISLGILVYLELLVLLLTLGLLSFGALIFVGNPHIFI
jgi:hypothetical protein